MTLRSRKKPPTTAPTHTATETSTLTASSFASNAYDSSLEIGSAACDYVRGPRKNLSTATVIAVAFVLLSLGLVLPAGAETPASEWSPSRPKRSLSSTKVSAVKAPVAKEVVNTTTENNGWSAATRSKNSSTRLQWSATPKKPSPTPKANAQTASQLKTSKPKQKLSQARSTTQMPRRVSSTPTQVKPPAVQKRVPIWAQESTTPDSLRATGSRPKASIASVSKEIVPTLKPSRLRVAERIAKSQLKAPVQQQLKSPIRQVQNTEELRLPIAGLRVPDLSVSTIPKVDPSIAAGFAAPSPDDVTSGGQENAFQSPITRQFQDQTPRAATGTPGTQTREVQTPSRFDAFDSLPELSDTPAPSQPDSILNSGETNFDSNPFEPPNADPPSVNSQQTPAELPTPQLESSTDLFAPVPDSNTDAPSPEGTDDENLQERLNKQLEDLDKLPQIDGSETGDTNELFGGKKDEDESPLFSEDDPEEDGVKGELAGTNGRDCGADAAACRADFEYLKRRQRTDMSLNISPSLTPTEVDMSKAEQTRIEKLAKAPTRTWRDRSGNVIADGNLDDYRNDKIMVRTVNGTMRTIPHHTLSDEDRCFVAGWWELPSECNFEGEQYAMRDFRLTTFTWKAAGTCHKPLYYEQDGVERYGHSSGPIVQPLVSGVHFFGDILMAPYHAGINPPNECQYTLGYYRPGDCAPWLMPGFPFTARGFKWEGLAIGAAIALMP